MHEKYETYRQRNEVLEKHYLEKETLYFKIKSENDQITDQLYSFKRISEDLKQENVTLKSKLSNAEES